VEPHSKDQHAEQRAQHRSRVEDMLMLTLFLVLRGRGRGRGGVITCYTCGKNGHKEFDCPDRKTDKGEAHII
jgi:hypothetical protein